MKKYLRFTKFLGGRIQWLTLFILAVPACWYAALYVPGQQLYFADRNFRVLNVLGEQLKARVTTSVTNLVNIASSASYATNRAHGQELISSRLELAQGLELVGNLQITTSNLPPRPIEVTVETNALMGGIRFQCDGVATNGLDIKFLARRDFSSLIGPRDEFDALMVAEADGSVVFQRSFAGWKALELQELSPEMETNIQHKASVVAEVKCGGRSYKMFLHPVFVPASGKQAPFQLWLCGLVELRRFWIESLAISHRFLVLFIFLALGVAASMPFVKVLSMGRYAPLRTSDVILMTFGTIFSTGLLTFFLLDILAYHRAQQKLDTQLRALGTNIYSHLAREVQDIRKQMEILDKTAQELADRIGPPIPLGPTHNEAVKCLDHPQVIKDLRSAPYPFFEMANWMNEEGQQLRKWTVRERNTPFINVKARDYFADALGDRHSLYEFVLGKTNWVQPIVSWNTGESTAVVAHRRGREVLAVDSRLLSVMRPILPPGTGFAIVAPDGQALLHSDTSRNLQENLLQECEYHPRLRSALLGGGTAPFPLRYLGRPHRFFTFAMPGSPWLLLVFRDAAVLNHANFDMMVVALCLFGIYFVGLALVYAWSGTWSSKRSRWLWPDRKDRDWYRRVVWLNCGFAFISSLLISFSTELFFSPLALAGLSILAAAIGIVSLAALRKARARTRAGLETHSGNGRRYHWVIASVLLLLGAVPAFGFFKLARDWQMQLLVKEGQLRTMKDLLQRHSRVENEYRPLMADDNRFTNFVSRRLYGTNDRAVAQFDLYTSGNAFFGTEITRPNLAPEPGEGNQRQGHIVGAVRGFLDYWFLTLVDWLRPLHYRTHGRTYGVFREKALDANRWHWPEMVDPGRLVLENQSELGTFRLTSYVPALNLHRDLWGLLVLAALLGAIYCLARLFIRQLFAPDLDGKAAPAIPAGARAQNRLILVPSHRPPSHPWLDDRSLRHVDFRNPDEWKPWLDKVPGGPIADADRIVVFHYLDFGYDDPEFNRNKLRLFEKLAADPRRTIAAASAVDPSHFRFFAGDLVTADEKTRDAAEAELNRWLKVFESFLRDPGKESVSPAPTTPAAEPSAHPGNTEHVYAQSYSSYRAIWLACSREEQLALFQLARYGFVNRKNAEVPFLLERGLIVRQPHFQLCDNAFARFVLDNFRLDELPASEQEQAPSLWNDLKKPLWIVVVGFALFLFLTQRDLFSATLTVIAGFSAGIPALVKFANTFDREKAGKS